MGGIYSSHTGFCSAKPIFCTKMCILMQCWERNWSIFQRWWEKSKKKKKWCERKGKRKRDFPWDDEEQLPQMGTWGVTWRCSWVRCRKPNPTPWALHPAALQQPGDAGTRAATSKFRIKAFKLWQHPWNSSAAMQEHRHTYNLRLHPQAINLSATCCMLQAVAVFVW